MSHSAGADFGSDRFTVLRYHSVDPRGSRMYQTGFSAVDSWMRAVDEEKLLETCSRGEIAYENVF